MGTELVNIQAELEKQALAIASRVAAPTGNRIKVNTNKSFRLPNGQEGPGPIDVVIVDFAAAHYYYTSPWQENNPVPPVCFAINFDANTLVPSPNSPDKQAEVCAVCPQNQFESAANGKGKACRNTRQLAVLPLDATDDTPIWLLSLSPTAIQPFDKFVTAMARKYNGPPMKIVTRIGFDPTVNYASLRFADGGPNPILEMAFNRQEEARGLLMQEPDLTQAALPPAAGAAKAAPRPVMRGGVKR